MQSLFAAAPRLDDGSAKKTRRKMRRVEMASALFFIIVSVFVLTGLFEMMMEYAHPDEEIWEAHLTTVIFGCCASAITAYFALKKYDSLLGMLEQAIEQGKLTENALQNSVAELLSIQTVTNELRLRLEEAEETERKRLAMELHDQVGQNLTALGINLSIVGGYLSKREDANIQGRLDDSHRLIEETAVRIREVMADLRPPGLDDFGIRGALQWLCEQFSNRTGIKATVKIVEPDSRPSPQIERTLFRIAQEALTNVARHAGARNIVLALDAFPGKIRMQLSDDGRGFNPEEKKAMNSPKWGLRIMRERAELAGGTLSIESRPGEGTRILVEVNDGIGKNEGISCR